MVARAREWVRWNGRANAVRMVVEIPEHLDARGSDVIFDPSPEEVPWAPGAREWGGAGDSGVIRVGCDFAGMRVLVGTGA